MRRAKSVFVDVAFLDISESEFRDTDICGRVLQYTQIYRARLGDRSRHLVGDLLDLVACVALDPLPLDLML